jgi:hypothetical protein
MLRLMLTVDGGRQISIEGGFHAVNLELTHEIEEFRSLHQMVLLRLS